MPRTAPTLPTLAACTLALLAGSAFAQDFQFRINQSTYNPATALPRPPTIGLVVGGDNLQGNSINAMAFSWVVDGPPHAVAIPFCDRICGDGFIFADDDHGGGTSSFANALYLRRFSNIGAGLDAADTTIASTPPITNINGPFLTPSLALCPLNTGPGRNNPYRLAWGDMWKYNTNSTCGTPSCANQPTAWWTLFWPSFRSPAPTAGSANFTQPAACRAFGASAAYGAFDSTVVWRDVTDACRQIGAGWNGNWTTPSGDPTVIIASAAPGFDVNEPCVHAIGTHFVAVWREDDFNSDTSAVYGRRIFPNGSLGTVFTVGFHGNVSRSTTPAVSVFTDGSFAVQYTEFQNGDPAIEPLVVKLFDEELSPSQVGSTITVLDNFGIVDHTISARGNGVRAPLNPTIHLASVYEADEENEFGSFTNIRARAINVADGTLGESIVVPLPPVKEDEVDLGRAHQHTALLRSDERLATAFYRAADNNVYASIRTLPPPTAPVLCDSIDFNNDGLFPDDNDLLDFLSVLAGGACSTDPTPGCNDIDFNNDGLFPDDADLIAFLTVLAGGAC